MKLLPTLFPLLFAFPLAAQAPVEASHGAELEAALASVDATKIRSDLTFIASDELKGRDTPSEGQRIAARFIRARLQRLGLLPGGLEGDYFHHYQMDRTQLDLEGTGIVVENAEGTHAFAFGEGYYFFRGVSDLDLAGEVVFAGTGSAEEVEWLDFTGKWALVWDSSLNPSAREENLRNQGAVGVVVASKPDVQDAHGPRAKQITRFIGRPSLRVVTKNSERPKTFPSLFVSQHIASVITGGAEVAVGDRLDATLHDARALSPSSETIELENVCGFWPGSDPELSKEVLIVSAHYDHVGTTEDGSEIFNGADDNGSGTVGLLAIAEALSAYGPLDRSVMLIWLSGEEKGLKGSEAWTLDPTLPRGLRAVANLNIDMIGRNAPDYLLITPTNRHPAYNGLTQMAEKAAPLEGFPELGSCDEYWERSDHRNFSVNMGIPVAFLFSDVHEDYHQTTDTVEKIDFDKIARVSRVVVRMLDELQDLDLTSLERE